MIEKKRKKVRERSRAFRCRQTSNLACLLEWWLKRVDRSLPELFRTFKDEPRRTCCYFAFVAQRASTLADDIATHGFIALLLARRTRPPKKPRHLCVCVCIKLQSKTIIHRQHPLQINIKCHQQLHIKSDVKPTCRPIHIRAGIRAWTQRMWH